MSHMAYLSSKLRVKPLLATFLIAAERSSMSMFVSNYFYNAPVF